MPSYCWRCKACSKTDETCGSIKSGAYELAPECCDMPMVRDLHAERFGGVASRSKGFSYTTDDLTGSPMEFTSIKHMERVAKEHGCHLSEPTAESRYRVRTRGDRCRPTPGGEE